MKLKNAGGLQVMLGDVARVELGTADVRRESRYAGATSISIGIVKQAVANRWMWPMPSMPCCRA